MSPEINGAEMLVRALELLGVELVFGLPGVHNLPIWRALARSSIRVVGVRHEQAAGYAADGYARAGGRLGVAIVTTGPGAANAAAAIGEALASGSPVLLIATDIPTTVRRPGVVRGALHETRDQAAMFAPIAKATRTLTRSDEVGPAVLEAGLLAQKAAPGPVYLGVPTDLLTSLTPELLLSPTTPSVRSGPAPAALADAARLIAAGERPLIWAGGGARGAGEQLDALARKLCAPLVTTYAARGVLAPDHPCAAPGPIHSPAVGELWDAAGLVIAVGTDFDAMMTQGWRLPAPSTLLAVNVDAADAGKNYRPTMTLEGEAAEVLGRLLPLVAERPGLDELRGRLAVVGDRVDAEVLEDEPLAAEFLAVLERVPAPQTVVVADMCIPGYWLAGYRRVPAPRKLSYPVGWGTLGYGFQAGIGAALAGGGPAVCVCGDGGFLFGCGELATIAQEQIPLITILVDDGGYGMLRFDQVDGGDEAFGVDLVGPDFEALARSFGVAAASVTGFGSAFERALTAFLDASEPALLVVEAKMKPPPTTSPRWYRKG